MEPLFKDNFSKQAEIYAKYRPHYPDSLYAFLASLTEEHKLAWDCGTGNGQAAIGLAAFYDHVIATDPSEQQISNCLPHPKIKYRIETAEANSITDTSVDLLTIANALHWFNHDVFYKECNRVLKKNGVIAAWAYGIPKISAEVDKVMQHYQDEILGTYWLPENKLVEQEYTTIEFPFELIHTPQFTTEREFTLDDIIMYLHTWSATQTYIRANNINPVEEIKQALRQAWGNAAEAKTVSWKLVIKVGRKT